MSDLLKYPIDLHTKLYNGLENKEIYIDNSWLLVPKALLKLIIDFVDLKKQYGSEEEKNYYSLIENDQIIPTMLRRMYKNRPLMFVGTDDYYILRNGEAGMGWDVPTENEEDRETDDQDVTIEDREDRKTRKISEYLTYDEFELNAFMSISIFTPFLNSGSRKNYGTIDKTGNYQQNGIYVGQVGARFQVPGKMEYKFLIISPEQNTIENGYGLNNQSPQGMYLKMWADFYGTPYFPTYDEVLGDYKLGNKRFYAIEKDQETPALFDTVLYKRRLRYNADVLLKEANNRAKILGKKAFCNIIGLGLGVWKLLDIQTMLTVEVYIDLLATNRYDYISDLYFAWFNITSEDLANNKTINKKLEQNKNPDIKLHIGNRDPADKINTDLLLVSNWAWDAASYIGNEYWDGNLGASGDPAAACSSYIAYIGHPDNIKNVHYW